MKQASFLIFKDYAISQEKSAPLVRLRFSFYCLTERQILNTVCDKHEYYIPDITHKQYEFCNSFILTPLVNFVKPKKLLLGADY